MPYKLILLLFLSTIIYAKEVLLLHSYHKAYEWTDSISKSIENSLKYHEIEITTEYMDTKRIYNKDYIESLFEFYKKRYKDRKFDIIIASDNNALEFLNTYHDKIFTDSPIVFCGINSFNKKIFNTYNIRKRTTGVVEEVDIKRNIDLIFDLHPKMKKLLVINDQTITGQEMKKEFFKVFNKYKDKVELEYIDKFKFDELQKKVSTLDENTIILFMLLHKDETGKVFTFKNGLKSIARNSNTPMYGLWDFYLNRGLVGGYVTHSHLQGESAAKMVKQLLAGKSVTNIPLIEKSPNSYIFDYKKLKKFDVDMSKLPQNSIVQNEPRTFYENYETELTIITVTFICFTIIIFMLIDSIEDKRKAKDELQIKLNFIRTLLNTMKNPIFYKDINGKYLGCNDAFCNFIGVHEEEIIGKTMVDMYGHDKKFVKVLEDIEKQLLKNKPDTENIIEYVTKEKSRTLIVNKSIYHNDTNTVEGIVTIIHDITELVQAQNEKQQHESFLIQQSKLAEIGEMINAIAHQWNEPLVEMSAIVQDLELVHKTSNITNNDMDFFVKDSMTQIQYMSKTLKDFRDFLKPSAKKSDFFIEDAFNEIFNIIERQIKYSYIDLQVYYSKQDLVVYGYKNEFMQVLITILNNAKDAIIKLKMDDISLNGKITVNVSNKNDIVEIQISDNGCGIEDKDRDFLFDPYYSTKEKGNGLGLYLSRTLIVDKMDGKIYFQKSKDITTLIIELPQKAL